MKHAPNLLLLALVLVASFAGIGRAQDSDADKLQSSLDKWSELKEKCGGNYRYFVRTSSFTGAGTETEIAVLNHKVAVRRYRVIGPPIPLPPGPNGRPPMPEAPKYEWTEQGETIGKHKEGAPPKTLDELYAQAQQVLARKLTEHEKRFVRFDKQGLLSSCFTIDTRIADDAPVHGVVIAEIRLETK
ncbi:MAG: hypothetical protein U0939_09310 [Pirellulales bacterium]